MDEACHLSAAQRRRLARHVDTVRRWWNGLPDDQRARPFFLSAELMRATGLPSTHLGPALRALGWQYAQRRIPELMNMPAAVWAPPEAPSPRRRPGRPAPTASTTKDTHA